MIWEIATIQRKVKKPVKCPFHLLGGVLLKLSTGEGFQSLYSLREVCRISIFMIGFHVSALAGEECGIEMRERALYFLPIHQRSANGFVQHALSAAALGKWRPIPRVRWRGIDRHE